MVLLNAADRVYLGADLSPRGFVGEVEVYNVVKFPAIRGTLTQFSGSTSSNSFTMPLPEHDEDDLLMLFIAADGASADISSIDAVNGVSWTSLNRQSANDAVEMVRFLRAGADQAATNITVTLNAEESVKALAYAIENAHATTDPEIATAGTSSNPPSLAPSWAVTKTLWFATYTSGNRASYATGAPSGYGNLTALGASGGNADIPSLSVCYRQTESESQDPGPFTLTTGSHQVAASTVAVRPFES